LVLVLAGIGIGVRGLLVSRVRHQYFEKPTTNSDFSTAKTYRQTLQKILIFENNLVLMRKNQIRKF